MANDQMNRGDTVGRPMEERLAQSKSLREGAPRSAHAL